MLQSLKACRHAATKRASSPKIKARAFFPCQCGACGWMTDAVKLGAVAVKLWNESKRESKA